MRTVRVISGTNDTPFADGSPQFLGRADLIMPWVMTDRTMISPFGDRRPFTDSSPDNPHPENPPLSFLGDGPVFAPLRFSRGGMAAWFGRTQRFRLTYDFAVTMNYYSGVPLERGTYTRSFAGHLDFDINDPFFDLANRYLRPDETTRIPDERYLPHAQPPGFVWQWTRPVPDTGDDPPPDAPYGGNTNGGVWIGPIVNAFLTIKPLLLPLGTFRDRPPWDVERFGDFPQTDFYLSKAPSGGSLSLLYLLYYEVKFSALQDNYLGTPNTHTLGYDSRMCEQWTVTASHNSRGVAATFRDDQVGSEVIIEGDPQVNHIAATDLLDSRYAGPDGIHQAVIYSTPGDAAVSFPDTGVAAANIPLRKSIAPAAGFTSEDYPDDAWSITALSVERIAPYFEFRNAAGEAVWDATTGAQLVTPVPPTMP